MTSITSDANFPGTALTIQQDGINALPIGTLLIPDKAARIHRFEHRIQEQVKLSLTTCDVYDVVGINGATQQKRYLAVLTYRFPKQYSGKATAADVEQPIEAILAPDASVQQPHTAAEAAPANNEFPPAPAAVSLGQTIDEVMAPLGRPEKFIDLGAKVTGKTTAAGCALLI